VGLAGWLACVVREVPPPRSLLSRLGLDIRSYPCVAYAAVRSVRSVRNPKVLCRTVRFGHLAEDAKGNVAKPRPYAITTESHRAHRVVSC
jgi:hypothetical protein